MVESLRWGYVAKLRPHGDSERDLLLIPDPTQTAINDGVVTAWQAFAKIVSIQHAVYFQAGLIACTVYNRLPATYTRLPQRMPYARIVHVYFIHNVRVRGATTHWGRLTMHDLRMTDKVATNKGK